MEFRDEKNLLPLILHENYKDCHFLWGKYIESLDLGILLDGYYGRNFSCVYKVVDEKKWLLSKIKYGI